MGFRICCLGWVLVLMIALLILMKHNSPKPYSCLGANHDHFIIIRIDDTSSNYSGIAQAILGDCFDEGCDPSVLMDSIQLQGSSGGIIVLISIRHGVVMGKWTFIPVRNIPGPNDDICTMINRLREKGFTEKEMASLLETHSLGKACCSFFPTFNGTRRPEKRLHCRDLGLSNFRFHQQRAYAPFFFH